MNENSNLDFYKNLKFANNFSEIKNHEFITSVPDDWYVVLTDVKNSTIAIQEGRYKDVNVIGAIGIVGITNIDKDLDFPFIFGGDGVAIIIPEKILENAKQSLNHTRRMAKDVYNLELRIGIFHVKELYKNNLILNLAKIRISKNYYQAIVLGNGLDYCEKILKSVDLENKNLLPEDNSIYEADYTGFSCIWKPVPSIHGEMISLLIKSPNEDMDKENNIYQLVLEKIDKLFGSENEHHPITQENVSMSFSEDEIKHELNINYKLKNLFLRTVASLYIRLFRLGAVIMIKLFPEMKAKGAFSSIDIKLKDAYITQRWSSDYKKFDGTLKMIISGTTDNRVKFIEFLEKLFKERKLVYGIHVSKEALMTCLMFEGTTKEVHFVDGSDGGYAMAAIDFKRRLKEF